MLFCCLALFLPLLFCYYLLPSLLVSLLVVAVLGTTHKLKHAVLCRESSLFLSLVVVLAIKSINKTLKLRKKGEGLGEVRPKETKHKSKIIKWNRCLGEKRKSRDTRGLRENREKVEERKGRKLKRERTDTREKTDKREKTNKRKRQTRDTKQTRDNR